MRSMIASADFAAIAAIVRKHAFPFSASRPFLVGALACALAGCATTAAPEADASLVIAPPVEAPADGDWWKTAGDPLLANLVERGIAADNDLACRAARLHEQEETDAAASRRLAGKVRALVGKDQAPERDAARMAWAYAYAQARADRATEVALAYVQVRRLQQILTLRTGRLDQFRDNAVIAEFRRQAGLVTAIDGGLGNSIAGVVDADVSATRSRFDAARAALAAMTGMTDNDLLTALGEKAEVPVISPGAPPAADAPLRRADLLALSSRLESSLAHAKVTQAELDAARAAPTDETTAPALRDALQKLEKAETGARAEMSSMRQSLAALDARQSAIDETAAQAKRAVSDARASYKAGFGDFATLYVAEAAALAADEARVNLKADRAAAIVRLYKMEGGGWSAADLNPPMGTATCD
ncbi:MAG: TolC family protein [Novosphingobium pentaromativorans]|uniref:TolC family protein n=1 Tax=Novosphingobium pentaromativorans TaxID=205844 RepID=A0A2W5NPJ7_9SPHN|nr:MAG: TolC family protein [Novosphingobium pentaromativorans]